MHLNISSTKWRLFGLGLNVLTDTNHISVEILAIGLRSHNFFSLQSDFTRLSILMVQVDDKMIHLKAS